MSEYVYILTNPAIPAWVKIGQTNDIRQRIKDLSRDVGVPFAFQEYAHLEVADSQKMESILHDMIKNDYKKRRSINEITMREKEFFELSAEEAYAIFQKVEALVASQGGKAKLVKAEPTDAELADQEIANQAMIRSGGVPVVLSPRWLGIPFDAELTCTKNDSVKAKVTKRCRGLGCEWQGTDTTLLDILREQFNAAKSAEKFLKDAFYADKKVIDAKGENLYADGNECTQTRVLWFWKYNDRTLLEIYSARKKEIDEQKE